MARLLKDDGVFYRETLDCVAAEFLVLLFPTVDRRMSGNEGKTTFPALPISRIVGARKASPKHYAGASAHGTP